MKPALELKIGTQLQMTPQLQQAISLLQMSSIELQAEVQSLIETNPFVEVNEKENEDIQEETEELSHLPNDSDLAFQPRRQIHSPLETLNASPLSLRDHLFWQMQLTPFSDTDRLIASAIIDAINDDGFLTSSIADIVKTLLPNHLVSSEEVEAVLHRIHQFDPIGVGARSLEECLNIQMNHLPSTTPWHHQAQMLITHYLLLLGKHDYVTLRRRLGLKSDELTEVIRLIQSLNPRPGSNIGDERPEFIVPDAYVFRVQKRWVVELNSQFTPRLSINQYYASIISSADNERLHPQSLRQQLQEAKWFLKSLEARNNTLQKVIEAIVSHQSAYLDLGEEYMKPLILQDIATELGMHESTVSRITSKKYLRTPRGVVELKFFFSGQINNHGAKDCSSTAVRAMIKKLIAQENLRHPYSDNALASLLEAQGISIARRTVAKYREELNILPSNERKKP